jgi:hypothetical protein
VHSTVLLLLLQKNIIIYNNTWHRLEFTDFENIDSLPALNSVYLSEFMPVLLFVSLSKFVHSVCSIVDNREIRPCTK